MSLTLSVPSKAAFSKYIRPRSWPSLEGAGHDLFRVTQSIYRCRVDPIHAELKGAVDRGNGVIIVLATPSDLPSGSTDFPGPKAPGCHKQIRIPKLFRLPVAKWSFFRSFLSSHDPRQLPLPT